MTGAPTRTAPPRAPSSTSQAANGAGGGAPGARLVAANRWFTVAFSAWSLLAVLVRPTRIPLAVVDLVAFGFGCVVYVLAYATAVSRSRTDAIGLGGLFFLADGAGPTRVRRSFWVFTAVQTVVAIAAAASRPFTPVAFGILAPIVGLSLMGLWGARFGRFGPRFGDDAGPPGGPPVGASVAPTTDAEPGEADEPSPSTREGAGMKQNERHG